MCSVLFASSHLDSVKLNHKNGKKVISVGWLPTNDVNEWQRHISAQKVSKKSTSMLSSIFHHNNTTIIITATTTEARDYYRCDCCLTNDIITRKIAPHQKCDWQNWSAPECAHGLQQGVLCFNFCCSCQIITVSPKFLLHVCCFRLFHNLFLQFS